ncbi:ImmA/IrrE family metallo-endopeptidase [bacterium]|nr:ImmA/IrrE family metallo-endopeptidase [bacterium]
MTKFLNWCKINDDVLSLLRLFPSGVAMSARVSVKPEIIQWAVRNSDMSEDDIYKKFPWTCDDQPNPTILQLQKFARTARIPYFNLLTGEIPKDREVPIPDFRTIGGKKVSQPSLNLLDILHIMRQRQEWMRDYLLSEGADPLGFIGSIEKTGTNPKAAAEKIRQDLNLEKDWQTASKTWETAYSALWEAVENAGIMLFQESGLDTSQRKRFKVEEFRGFVLSDPYAPLIFINSADAKNARMFTLAHEIAHLWMDETGLFDFTTETVANKIAAELLVPEDSFREAWKKNQDLGALSHKFKVSTIVIMRRAWDCGLISDSDFLSFFQEQQDKFEEKKNSGGNFYLTRNCNLSTNFVAALIASADSGRTLYRDAYQLLGMSGDTYHKFASRWKRGEFK